MGINEQYDTFIDYESIGLDEKARIYIDFAYENAVESDITV